MTNNSSIRPITYPRFALLQLAIYLILPTSFMCSFIRLVSNFRIVLLNCILCLLGAVYVCHKILLGMSHLVSF